MELEEVVPFWRREPHGIKAIMVFQLCWGITQHSHKGGGSVPKIKKSTIKILDFFVKRGGGTGFPQMLM